MSDAKRITKDIAIPVGTSKEGNPQFLRVQGTDEKPTRVSLGQVLPVKEGEPVMHEVVNLKHVEGANHLEVETVIASPFKDERARNDSQTRSYPSAMFRANWASVFGRKPKDAN